jgi:Tfp pilus assembly protein PilP
MRRTSILASLVCAAVAASAQAADAPADTTKTTVPATTPTPVAQAPVESDAPAATTSANGKVVIRENLYYYDAFNRRDPFRSLVDGAFNRSDKMDQVNLNAVQLVGIVRGEVDRFALLEDASGYSYILRVGDRVHNGTVVSIGEDELVARVTNFGQTTTVRLHLVGR